ncbi:hypothetical protein EVAR_85322_1 [Eumeta japonica]|uniref:Uncharacterized protein n=1 Tax=Eumeta variegata TaxID=151549 RepID=A0A4C2A2D3_EUMVA|nr:hypothetical protein EVAR_85322_1 [Eumeta japonica]
MAETSPHSPVREEFCPPSWCVQRWHDLKCRGFDCLGTERLTQKYTRRCKEMKKNCEKGTIIARHLGDVMVLA